MALIELSCGSATLNQTDAVAAGGNSGARLEQSAGRAALPGSEVLGVRAAPRVPGEVEEAVDMLVPAEWPQEAAAQPGAAARQAAADQLAAPLVRPFVRVPARTSRTTEAIAVSVATAA